MQTEYTFSALYVQNMWVQFPLAWCYTGLVKLSEYIVYWCQFVWTMTEREIKARYRNAVFGFLWIVINPLLQMLVIGCIFQYFVPVEIENYFAFLFAGLLFWNFFSYTVLKAVPSFYYERTLIKKAKFPREAIPLSLIFSNLFNLIIAIGLFALVMLYFQQGSFVVRLPLLLPAFVISIFLTVGLSLFMATLNVFWRDIYFAVQAVMPLWFYSTPVLYTLDILPEFVKKILSLNPFVSVVLLSQYVFTGQGIQFLTTNLIFTNISVTLIIFLLGCLIFVRANKSFDDWL